MTRVEHIRASLVAMITDLRRPDGSLVLASTFDHVPKDLLKLPAATLEFTGIDQEYTSTGGGADVRWKFELVIYLNIAADRAVRVQDDLGDALYALAAALRDDPTLSGLVDIVNLSDGEKPTVLEGGGYIMKTVELIATTEEA